jgi:hypothetical protein
MDKYKSGLDAYKKKDYKGAMGIFNSIPRDHPKYLNSRVAYAKLKKMLSGDTSMPQRSQEEKEKALKKRYEDTMSIGRKKKALSSISSAAKPKS